MMSEKKLLLKVLTPNQCVLEERVDFVILRTVEGDFGVLPGHEACTVLLDYGLLRAYVGKRQTAVLAVLEGFATVQNDELTVLSAVAEHPEKIEATLAEMERERTATKISEQTANLEMHRVESALRHSLVHMDISSYAIIKGHNEQQQ